MMAQVVQRRWYRHYRMLVIKAEDIDYINAHGTKYKTKR